MRIAIIGGGFAGLSAAYYGEVNGHETTIFEKEPYLGGLAAGMNTKVDEVPPWEWELELFYHHWFTNDDSVFNLAKDIGVRDKIIIQRPISATWINGKKSQLDSPVSLLRFPDLSWQAKFKTALTLAQLKYYYTMERSKAFEGITAHEYLQKHMGTQSYKLLWEPLLQGKFEDYYQDINMRWFWARIYKRTPNLAYYEGGFAAFAEDIAQAIQNKGGKIKTNTVIQGITPLETEDLAITYQEGNETISDMFDAVIVTTPPPTLNFFFDELPHDYKESLSKMEGIGAFVLVFGLHHPFMQDTYWLNINEKEWPFLSVVEHTNFIHASHYNNEHVLYVGDYVEKDHPHMNMTKEELIEKFTPYLKEINPLFSQESIIRSYLFKTPYAQPIVKLNHEKNILPLETPIKNVYLATMAQVYPWDRGTNYAIEIGQKAVAAIKS